ncbi:unnamed protein product, partial [Mesorhabditis belari]|uniref:Nicastrin n=1 Tax=Mesorhabditis belari TaxID=2138241 RepID=A0AAF3F5G8_9BILA
MWLLLGFLSVIFHSSWASLSDQVYVQLEPESVGCFRLLNGTHQFGCQSSRGGDVGLVVRANMDTDVRYVDDCWKARYPEWDGGFAVLVSHVNFHSSGARLYEKLRASPCVSMVLLYEVEPLPDVDGMPNSDDSTCPNENSGIYANCSNWNVDGAAVANGLSFTDWPKPVIFLRNTSNIEKLMKCANVVNKALGPPTDWPVWFPLCAVSVKMFSYAAGNSDMCMRRSRGPIAELDAPVTLCDPLQDLNVFIAMPPKAADKQTEEPKPRTAKYLSIATRMDSLSFIPEVSPGDFSTITSIMTVLAAAKAIAAEGSGFEAAANASDRRILFSFFHGEAFDYIGSSRALFDMSKEQFPASFDEKLRAQKEIITPDQLEAMIEVQQVGAGEPQTYEKFYAHLHRPAYDKDKKLTDKFVDAAQSLGSKLNYEIELVYNETDNTLQLPPSSLYSVYRNSTTNLRSGILLTQFKEKYQYTRINSMIDHSRHSDVNAIRLPISVRHGAEILVAMANDYVGFKPKNVTIDEAYINQLFKCFISSKDWWTCDLFAAVLEPIKPYMGSKKAKTTYIGADGASLIRHLVFGLAVDATGVRNLTTNVHEQVQCDQLNHHQTLYHFLWQRSGNDSSCLRSTVFTTKALSPAFIDETIDLTNTTFSTWTEASYSLSDGTKYSRAGPRLFVMERIKNEQTTVVVALLTSLIAVLVVGRLSVQTFIFDEGEDAAEHGEPL